MEALLDIIKTMQGGPLFHICHGFLKDVNRREFHLWPASLSKHHAYPGGLLSHTTEVCLIADGLASSMKIGPLSRDVVLAACFWHDVAKTQEYVLAKPEDVLEGRRSLPAFGGMVWTKSPDIADGECPHIAWSAEAFIEAAEGSTLNPSVVDDVKNCILSHHGRVEWGAPFEPLSLEAHIVHMADMLSAKYGANR